jgi:hypothetical protein
MYLLKLYILYFYKYKLAGEGGPFHISRILFIVISITRGGGVREVHIRWC